MVKRIAIERKGKMNENQANTSEMSLRVVYLQKILSKAQIIQ
jgi:hypothetical protein